MKTLPQHIGPMAFSFGLRRRPFGKNPHELPEYDYLYLGDNARTPYGNRSFEVVYAIRECVTKLFEQGCHLVIWLACLIKLYAPYNSTICQLD